MEEVVWAKAGSRGKLNMTPVVIKAAPKDCPIRVQQQPLSLEGRKGLQAVIPELKMEL